MPLTIEPGQTFEDFAAAWKLPVAEPRSREMYDEAVHAAEVYATLDATECPAWCALPAGHPYESEAGATEPSLYRHHVSRVGGAYVSVCEYLRTDGAEYTDREIFVDPGEALDSAQARNLAAQIIAASDLLDTDQRGVGVTAVEVLPDGLSGGGRS